MPVDVPDVSYARSGDVAIAYQVVGEGPIDLVFVRGYARRPSRRLGACRCFARPSSKRLAAPRG